MKELEMLYEGKAKSIRNRKSGSGHRRLQG